MFLKKIEVHGFKSFADKTDIDFGRGITAIVGPNGSGKSNIADAVLWVLGEQSLKALRSAKAEDVIFAGSDKRRATGMAEVTLIFDNSEGLLPIEYNEVAITRRLFRSGDSEYLINRNQCRLKDIYELLAGTGLGKSAMTVLGQNRMDEVLNSRAEDRRLIFEDAAGISLYKQRKRDAIRKMEDARNNLSRVEDIIGELESILGPLKESADKAIKAQEITVKLNELRQRNIIGEIQDCERQRKDIVNQEQMLVLKAAELVEKLLSMEALAEIETNKQENLSETLSDVETALQTARLTVEQIISNIALLEEKSDQAHRRLQRSASSTEDLRVNVENSEQEIDTTHNLLAVNEQNIADSKSNVEKINLVIKEKSNEIMKIEEALEIIRADYLTQVQENTSRRNRLDYLQEKISGFKKDKFDKESEIASGTEKLSDLIQKQSMALMAEKNENETLQSLKQSIEEFEKNSKRMSIKIESNQTAEKDLLGKIHSAKSRLHLLETMQNEYEGMGKGVRAILKTDAEWQKEILGVIAELIKVPDNLVLAVETALGAAAQNVVVANSETAKKAIKYLKDRNCGRATFMPLDHVQNSNPITASVYKGKNGILGIAADMVIFNNKYDKIVRAVLGRTIIALNMDSAMNLMRENNYGLRIVTVSGELFAPGGAITGGSIMRKEAGFIGRKNEIEALRRQLQQSMTEIDNLKNDLDTVKGEREKILAMLSEMYDGEKSSEIHIAELKTNIEIIARDHDLLNKSIQYCREEFDELNTQMLVCDREWQSLRSQVAEQQIADDKYRLQAGGWQEKLQSMRSELELVEAQRADASIKLATFEQKKLSFVAEIERLVRDKQNLEGKLDMLNTEVIEINSDIKKFQNDLAQKNADLVKRKQIVEKTQEKRDGLVTEKNEAYYNLQKINRDIRKQRNASDECNQILQEKKLQIANIEFKLQEKFRRLSEEFGLQIDNIDIENNQRITEEEKRDMVVLSKYLDEIGPVNPLAPEEYNNSLNRYDFLNQQKNDLLLANEKLEQIIAEMDVTMTEQLSEAFQIINGNFQDMFMILFGGGKASLELSQSESILTAGIEIIAQPPGKKLQNLSLLSGGERALTVVALLMAILKFRPAPFCVVDEIDAALDEANARRLGDLLREFSADTQFLVVTHRKSTMEVADILHGVTLAEAGVSRLLSVDFAA